MKRSERLREREREDRAIKHEDFNDFHLCFCDFLDDFRYEMYVASCQCIVMFVYSVVLVASLMRRRSWHQ